MDATGSVAHGGEGGRVTREEPRRRDWWLAGCGLLAAALIVVDVAAVRSDEVTAGLASTPRTDTTAGSTSGEASTHIPSSGVPVVFVRHSSTGECKDFIVRVFPSGSQDPLAAEPASRIWNSAIRSGLC